MSLLELIGFIKRGKNRQKVFKAVDKPSMPSEITKKIYNKFSNTYFNIVSRSLSELKDKGLIEVINPKEKTGRIYRKTRLGESVYKKLKEIE
jgi:predicted transcriptional regulator